MFYANNGSRDTARGRVIFIGYVTAAHNLSNSAFD